MPTHSLATNRPTSVTMTHTLWLISSYVYVQLSERIQSTDFTHTLYTSKGWWTSPDKTGLD